FDPATVKYYRELLTELKNDGTRTFVTLFHFTLPRWLSDKGGWEVKETSDAFGEFAGLAAAAFGDLVDYWITINEPLAYAYQGYVNGVWPPGHRSDYLGAFTCVRNMLAGHARAYAAIRKEKPNSMVSFTMHWRPFRAKRIWSPLDQLVRYYRHYVFNEMFPKAVETGELVFPYPLSRNPGVQKIAGPIEGLKGTMDYLAINYYTRELSEFYFSWPLDLFGKAAEELELETSCMGWELYPDGLYNALIIDLLPFRYNRDGSERPIFITENGYATAFTADLDEGDWSLADDQRVSYLTSHLMALHRAIENGANVKGYIYWSLMDNFEWAEGLRPRFGLVRIAYPSQSRTLRKSAEVYAEIARHNRLRLASNG
ncbi:MAG TPA: family 1 glycosylhydrolase, partial [Chroococcales cyanobacterium]